MLRAATSDSVPALLVALDNISDPRNLGAIVRSVAAFGGHGVLIPQRRSASVTAVAWRTSAGAAARLPVARATNLNRTLKEWADAGLQVVGLDADGDTTLDELDGSGPIVVVVGSEGKGLSRLVRENCDAIVSIPMAGPDGVAQRVGGRRRGAGRDRPSATGLENFRQRCQLGIRARTTPGQPHSLGDIRRRERRGPSKVGAKVSHRRRRLQQGRRPGGEVMGNS